MSEEPRGRGRPRAEFSMDDIGEKVLAELNRRLSTKSLAGDIPGTQLMQLAQRYIASLEKLAQAAAADAPEEVKLSPLELIDVPGLSLDRKVQILDPYLDRLEAEWRVASSRFEEMQIELRAREAESGSDDDSPVPE